MIYLIIHSMKAKHFKRLRKKLTYYNVWEFSNYNRWKYTFVEDAPPVLVLAYNEIGAIIRYNKRTNKHKGNRWGETVPKYAEYCVQPAAKPFERFKKYYS